MEFVLQDLPLTDIPIDHNLNMTEYATQNVLQNLQNDLPTQNHSATREEPEAPTISELCALPEPADPNLDNVTLPPKSKKRGKSEGSNSIVIELPKKNIKT